MRTNDIKHLAEEMEEEYEEALAAHVADIVINGLEHTDFPDIFTWVVMQKMTAQEDYNKFLRDEGVPDQ